MKKHIGIWLLLTALLITCFAACGGNAPEANDTQQDMPAETAIREEPEPAEKPEAPAEPEPQMETINSSTPKTLPTEIAVGDVITIPDKLELTVDFAKFITGEWKEAMSSNSYMIMGESGADTSLLGIRFVYKNTSTEPFDCFNEFYDVFSDAKLVYAEKYTYSGNYTYATTDQYVNPLMSCVIGAVFELPREMADSSESISVEFTIGGEKYHMQIRDGEASEQALTIGTPLELQGQGRLTLTSVTREASLYPSKKEGAYHYYQAENGRIYLIAAFQAKNLGTQAISTKKLLKGGICVGQSQYQGTCIVDYNGDLAKAAEINPSEEVTLYLVANVPQNLKEEPITLDLTFCEHALTFSEAVTAAEQTE